MSAYKYLFKFIVIGDSYVGKSCLVQQFLRDQPRQEHEATVGIEFGVKDINLSGQIIRLSIWDTAGQETFRSLIRAYYRSAIGVFLCYDCSSMQSFNGVEKWVQEVNDNGNENVVIALVCNKIDLHEYADPLQLILVDKYHQSKEDNMLLTMVSSMLKFLHSLELVFNNSSENYPQKSLNELKVKSQTWENIYKALQQERQTCLLLNKLSVQNQMRLNIQKNQKKKSCC